MQLIEMIALQPTEYGGHTLSKGEIFRCTPIEAASLRYRGKADFFSTQTQKPPASDRTPTHEQDLPVTPAEVSEPAPLAESESEAESDPATRSRRRGRRPRSESTPAE